MAKEKLTTLEEQGALAASLLLTFALAVREVGDEIVEGNPDDDTLTDFEKGKLSIITAILDHLHTQMSQSPELFLLGGFEVLDEIHDLEKSKWSGFEENMYKMLQEMKIVERWEASDES
jgi:hypothetical protein